jgi:hypothetical protein
MKITKFFIGVGFVSASMLACQKEEIASSEELVSIQYATVADSVVKANTAASTLINLKLSQVPISILRYLASNHPNNVFLEAKKSINPNNVTTYLVKIKVGVQITELVFDDKGQFLRKSQDGISGIKVPETELLPAIKEYIKANFPDYRLIGSEKYTKGTNNTYDIKLKSSIGLVVDLKFDSKGVLISSSSVKGIGTSIKEADLLTVIKDYIKTNYAGFAFVKADKYLKSGTSYFEVKLVSSAGKTVELRFNADGKILSPILNPNGSYVLKESDLLEPTKSYLKSKYTSYTFVSAKKIVNSSETYYIVVIKTGDTVVELKFKGNGEIYASTGSSNSNEIAADKLLPVIKTYLETNFKGYTFVNALKITAEKVDYYFVNFKLNNVTYQVKFDSKGAYISHSSSAKEESVSIKVEQILPTMREYLAKNYQGYSFVSAVKITKVNVVTYVVVIKYKDIVYTLTFNDKGSILSVKK